MPVPLFGMKARLVQHFLLLRQVNVCIHIALLLLMLSLLATGSLLLSLNFLLFFLCLQLQLLLRLLVAEVAHHLLWVDDFLYHLAFVSIEKLVVVEA